MELPEDLSEEVIKRFIKQAEKAAANDAGILARDHWRFYRVPISGSDSDPEADLKPPSRKVVVKRRRTVVKETKRKSGRRDSKAKNKNDDSELSGTSIELCVAVACLRQSSEECSEVEVTTYHTTSYGNL